MFSPLGKWLRSFRGNMCCEPAMPKHVLCASHAADCPLRLTGSFSEGGRQNPSRNSQQRGARLQEGLEEIHLVSGIEASLRTGEEEPCAPIPSAFWVQMQEDPHRLEVSLVYLVVPGWPGPHSETLTQRIINWRSGPDASRLDTSISSSANVHGARCSLCLQGNLGPPQTGEPSPTRDYQERV